MRGRCYDSYRKGIWSEYETTSRKLRTIKNEAVLTFTTFTFSEEDIPMENKVDVLPSSRFSSDVLLANGDSRTFDLSAESLACSEGGVLIPNEWDMKTGYTLYRGGTSAECPFPDPQPPGDPTLKSISDSAAEIADAMIADASGGAPGKEFKTDSELADFYVSYFLNNYKYKIHGDIRRLKNEDPVGFFFREKSGHCEFFATALALVLRKHGVPTRYVTGFVCEEKNPLGNYYVARLGNAHAWTEAWLRDRQKWVLLEPTPPDGISNFPHDADSFEEAGDLLKTLFSRLLVDVRRGYFAKAVFDFFAVIIDVAMKAVDHPFILIVLMLVILTLWIAWRRKRKLKAENPFGLAGHRLSALKAFSSVLKSLSRQAGIRATPSWTIEDWNSRLKSQKKELRDNFRRLAAKYEIIRFSSRELDENELMKFIEDSKLLMSIIKSVRR
jgi:hypothetical protein